MYSAENPESRQVRRELRGHGMEYFRVDRRERRRSNGFRGRASDVRQEEIAFLFETAGVFRYGNKCTENLLIGQQAEWLKKYIIFLRGRGGAMG
jgi:hypothetical protein